jgi:putative hemolysin
MTPLSLIVIAACFLFSALFSGAETGSYMINRIRLRQRERKRQSEALVLSGLLRNSHIFIFTVLIGNNIAIYLLSREVTELYLNGGLQAGRVFFGLLPWNAEMAATVTLMFPVFIFAEVGPKNLFRQQADVLMYRFAGVLRFLVLVFYPLTWMLQKLFSLLTHGMNDEPGRELHRLSPDGLKVYFSDGEKEGLISSYQSRMMDNATSMHSVPVRRLMAPLKRIPRLPVTATVSDFKRLVARRNTAFALLMDKHAVVGMVSIFTIVNRKLSDEATLEQYADEILELQENRNLKSAFYRLRRNPKHSAVVLDARKHPVGFIRLEDIARYIAGE